MPKSDIVKAVHDHIKDLYLCGAANEAALERFFTKKEISKIVKSKIKQMKVEVELSPKFINDGIPITLFKGTVIYVKGERVILLEDATVETYDPVLVENLESFEKRVRLENDKKDADYYLKHGSQIFPEDACM